MTIIFSLAIGMAIAPLGIAVAFGQEAGDVVVVSELPERQEQFINARVTQMTLVFEKFGFSDFEYIPEQHKITVAGYENDVDIQEDLASLLAEHFGFAIIDYSPHSEGTYFVAVWNEEAL